MIFRGLSIVRVGAARRRAVRSGQFRVARWGPGESSRSRGWRSGGGAGGTR